jgi:hypothetical protein
MYYYISNIKENENCYTCDFFVAEWSKNKKYLKQQLLWDLTVYNAFYNKDIPQFGILTDKKWRESYPQFNASVQIRNIKYDVDNIPQLELNQRLWTKEQIEEIVKNCDIK